MKLYSPINNKFFEKQPSELAYFIGYAMGDGCVNRCNIDKTTLAKRINIIGLSMEDALSIPKHSKESNLLYRKQRKEDSIRDGNSKMINCSIFNYPIV